MLSGNSMFVATLIANPRKPVLSEEIAHSARQALGATNLYWLADGIACDIPINEAGDGEARLATALAGYEIDFAVQPQTNRRKKLLIADMDSTMIEQECIDELAEAVGLKEKVAAITARAMNGEIAFEPALRERVALLTGLSTSVVEDVIREKITLTPGARELVRTMRKNGAYTALVSGGFTAFTTPIAATIGFDENRANRLLARAGTFTGFVAEPILGKEAKLEALEDICARLGISLDNAIAVGDGANDLLMLKAAGAGVALHAKPSVAAEAKIRLNYSDLTGLLYLQGYRKADFVS
jgi:phosphoserine phosphatase